ncbi:MAG: cation transporter, partial [Nitrospirae bacterium]
ARTSSTVTWVGTVANLILSVVKIAGGLLGHSQALVADGFHSLSDLLSDVATLITLRYASEPEDEGHPYGHGKIESVGAAVVGTMLGMAGFELMLDGGERLYRFWTAGGEGIRAVSPFVLGLALLSIVAKEGLYQVTVRVGRREQNAVLIANAWHHRSDALSSVVVLVGVGGALLWHLLWLDAAAALLVAAMVLKVAVEILRDAVADLTDRALSDEERARLRRVVEGIEGVVSFHEMRTRRFGGRALVDLHIQVAPYISVSEGHQIAERVRWALREADPQLIDVMVHVDSEDDVGARPAAQPPPTRAELERFLPGQVHQIHYLDGKVEVDLLLRRGEAVDPEAVRALKERWPEVEIRETFTAG